MGIVIPFERPDSTSTTIVEKTEWTDELVQKFQQAFDRSMAGFETSGDDDGPSAA